MTDPLDAIPADVPPPPGFVPRPAAAVPLVAVQRRRFGLGRLLRWWFVTGTLLLLAILAFVAVSGFVFDFEPLHIVIDGDEFSQGIQITGLTAGAKALLVAGALVVLFIALLVVPLVLVLAFAAISLALVGALLGMGIALAVATSPVWIVVLLVWLVARRRTSLERAASARMVA